MISAIVFWPPETIPLDSTPKASTGRKGAAWIRASRTSYVRRIR